MDDHRVNRLGSNSGGKIPTSFHHHHHGGSHHHFFYVSPNCPLHRSILQPNNHSPSCSFSTSYPSPQNPQPLASIPPDPHFSFVGDDAKMMQDGTEKLEVEEEEEEPIFVLTDEWREFFAKSEAKRRLAKKQAKKGKN